MIQILFMRDLWFGGSCLYRMQYHLVLHVIVLVDAPGDHLVSIHIVPFHYVILITLFLPVNINTHFFAFWSYCMRSYIGKKAIPCYESMQWQSINAIQWPFLKHSLKAQFPNQQSPESWEKQGKKTSIFSPKYIFR